MCDDTRTGSSPLCILLFSGKRKSGKDYVTDILHKRIGKDNSVIIKLSAPIKCHWATTHGLDLAKLLDCTEYKEHYRKDMIEWGESMRQRDYGYFCEAALKMFNAEEKPVWIISDARRKTDMKWFKEKYGCWVKTVRVEADEQVRIQRGWIFTEGVDDDASECDLDDVLDWDWQLKNHGTAEDMEKEMQFMLDWIHTSLNSRLL